MDASCWVLTRLHGARYARGDPVESWLHELLCLDASDHIPSVPSRLPHPSECELYMVQRDTLFSYHKVCLMGPFSMRLDMSAPHLHHNRLALHSRTHHKICLFACSHLSSRWVCVRCASASASCAWCSGTPFSPTTRSALWALSPRWTEWEWAAPGPVQVKSYLNV